MSPHRKCAHAHYFPQFVEWWSYVRSPLWYSDTGQELVPPRWGAWRMSRWVRERFRRRLPVNYGCRGLLSYDVFIYLFCIEPLLYNKDVTLIYVPWVIICVRLDPITHLILIQPWCCFKKKLVSSTNSMLWSYIYHLAKIFYFSIVYALLTYSIRSTHSCACDIFVDAPKP
jgi:hypothetical protein